MITILVSSQKEKDQLIEASKHIHDLEGLNTDLEMVSFLAHLSHNEVIIQVVPSPVEVPSFSIRSMMDGKSPALSQDEPFYQLPDLTVEKYPIKWEMITGSHYNVSQLEERLAKEDISLSKFAAMQEYSAIGGIKPDTCHGEKLWPKYKVEAWITCFKRDSSGIVLDNSLSQLASRSTLYYMGDLDRDLAIVSRIDKYERLKNLSMGYGEAQRLIRLYANNGEIGQTGPDVEMLKKMCDRYGVTESQVILQVVWAKLLRDNGLPVVGALGPQ